MIAQGTELVFSYFESRGGKFKEVLFFGLQYILKKHLVGSVVTNQMIDEAKEFFSKHLNDPEHKFFNEAGWRYIVDKHGGKLPLEKQRACLHGPCYSGHFSPPPCASG